MESEILNKGGLPVLGFLRLAPVWEAEFPQGLSRVQIAWLDAYHSTFRAFFACSMIEDLPNDWPGPQKTLAWMAAVGAFLPMKDMEFVQEEAH